MTTYRLWLAALPAPVPEAEARIFWNCKDEPTPALDEALRRAPHIYVGSWGEEHEELLPRSCRCPAARLSAWLFFKGTIDRWQAPILDPRLHDELLELLRPRPDDLPAPTAPTARAHEIRSFLSAHAGRSLIPQEEPPSADQDALSAQNP
ncbi:hypothetical protein GCM10009678_13740 [Actinomadura kijaniata]|uniref:Uncharacterized protein n=1 Tax=Actinomadura namibiensis TaxID=182080 RepID=A0A7W3QMZ7_ACTNM|nr:hypothetical protein [Actinomadura namibiensis]MBA8952543.1 hypothetical protein [Actinomadura namibiensis]